MSYIVLKDITKKFGDHTVLNDVSFEIEQGEFITLLGPSGCGKTTLLRILAGLERSDNGAVTIDGCDMTFAEPKARRISMIFQQYSLFPTMTVEKNIAFGLKMHRTDRKLIPQKIEQALRMVALSGSEKKYPGQLSGGEQQRVALARAIVTDAKMLLLDEPFSAIDAKLRKALQIQIKELHQELGLTTIFVTHDQDEAMSMSDRIYLMHGGRVEQTGTPMELYLEPQTPYVAGFMGHYNLFEEHGMALALRPEVIMLSRDAWPHEKAFVTGQGIVHRVMAQGNIIRYTVKTAERMIDVDVLYNSQSNYHIGDTVYYRYDPQQIKRWAV